MAAIPWPLSSSPGVANEEGAGRLINAYGEKQDDGSVIYYRAPGLRELVDVLSHSHCRGLFLSGSTLIAVFDQRVYTITLSGSTFTAVNRGALAGTLPVTIAQNDAATPNIVTVTENGAFNLFTGSAPSAFADADVGAPNSVTFLYPYLLFTYGDGTVKATGVNDVSITTNSFTRTDSGLLRGIAHGGEFFAFGSDVCQVYRDAATTPFPLAPVATIARGLIGAHAVAGFEPGFPNELIWVGSDNVVYRKQGYAALPISSHAVSRAVAAASDRSAIRACVAMAGQHAYVIITSPGDWTWVHDLTTGWWHERQSFGADAFRGSCSVRAFDRWIIGDTASGKLGEFVEGHYREFGDPLVFKMRSAVLKTFPSRADVGQVDFDFTAGVGVASGENPVQTDPQVAIRYSKTGGATWSDPVLRTLGAQGKHKYKPSLKRGIGIVHSPGPRFEVAVSDPVHVGFRGAEMAIQALAA